MRRNLGYRTLRIIFSSGSFGVTRNSLIADAISSLVCLQRKVAGVKEVDIGVGMSRLNASAPAGQAKRVVLAPHRQKPRLVGAKFAEIALKSDIALCCSIVAEEVELDCHRAGAGQVEIVEAVPSGDTKVGRAHRACTARPLSPGERKRSGCAVRFGRVLPVGADRVPAVAEALVVGIAILRDDSGYALGVADGEAKTSWRAVVEDVDGEASKRIASVNRSIARAMLSNV